MSQYTGPGPYASGPPPGMRMPPAPPQPVRHDVAGLVLAFLSLTAGAFLGGSTIIVALVGDLCGLILVGLVFLSAQHGPQQWAPAAAAVGALACLVGLVLTMVHGITGPGDTFTLIGGSVALVAFVALLVRTRSWFRT